MKKILLTVAMLGIMVPIVIAAQSADTTAPTVPGNLTIVGVLSSEIDLSWIASSDTVGVAGYKIFRLGGGNTISTQVATSTNTSYQDTGLLPSTLYTYSVRSYDAAGNISDRSNNISATTLTAPGGGGGGGGSSGGTTGGGGGSTGGTSGSSGTPSSGASGQPATPPSASAPYQFQRQGIFDCNQNGAYAMSVGALGAIGGAYVPVADAAVELNTGILVYKECVLREVVDREREAATSAFLKKAYTGIQAGRNGSPYYVVNQGKELLDVSDQEFLAILQDGTLRNLNANLQGPVTRALARSYQAQTRSQQDILTCQYKGDLNAALNGQPQGSIWEALSALGNPACNPIGAYYLGQTLAGNRIAQAVQYQRDQWYWANGYYSITDDAQDPLARKILTPGINVQQSFQTILDSPVRQLESANDVGQMISALYAGVTTQIISDNQGLAGLSKSSGGQLSYLDQVAKESAQGVRNAAVNAALQILNAAHQVESAYNQTVNKIASILTNAINQLRSAERQCWNIIIPKVCATPLAADNTCFAPTSNCTESGGGTATCIVGTLSKTVPITSCTVTQNPVTITCPVGFKLKVVTTTAFSQAVIEPQITPLATTTLANIDKSQKATRLIGNLITSVTNTASLDAQRLSLQQLDSLVAQRALHTQPDLVVVTQQKDSVDAAMTTLVENTVKSWADSGDPSVGWCNVNNQAVIDMWIQKWKIPLTTP